MPHAAGDSAPDLQPPMVFGSAPRPSNIALQLQISGYTPDFGYQWWSLAWASRAIARTPHLISHVTASPQIKIRNICQIFCSTFTPIVCTGIKVKASETLCGGPHWRLLLGGLYGGPSLEGHFCKGPYLYIPVPIRAPFVESLLWEAQTEGPLVEAL